MLEAFSVDANEKKHARSNRVPSVCRRPILESLQWRSQPTTSTNFLPMNFRDPASSTDCFRGSTYNVGLLVLALGLLVHPAHRGFLTIMRYINPRTC